VFRVLAKPNIRYRGALIKAAFMKSKFQNCPANHLSPLKVKPAGDSLKPLAARCISTIQPKADERD
jgi:hypothetical protein